jgi:replicative DNA helicase
MIDSVSETAGAAADLKKTRRQKAGCADGRLTIDRLPPHSIECEKGVLGCVLLSPNECMGECLEKIRGDGKDVFYDLRHQTIFETLVTMFDTREAIDVITLQQRLKDQQLLEQVGGIAYLAQLQDAVPSAANLSYYLEHVQEKYLLRKMIHTCTDVVGRVYDYEGEVDALMDEVERDILRISESRAQSSALTTKELVGKAIGTIENYFSRKGVLNGLATGFADLDRMTDGLHGSEMIVIAARPSMGKCLSFDSEIVLSDGSISTIQELFKKRRGKLLTLKKDLKFALTRPGAFVDDGLKPVFRVTTRLGRSVEATLPHPFLTIRGWTKLAELKAGEHIAVPRKLEVFGSDVAPECEIKILAYLIGDGCLTHHSLSFTNSNRVVRDDFSGAVADFGGMTTRYADSNGTRTPYLRVVADPDFIARHRRNFGERLRSAIVGTGKSSRQIALSINASPVSMHEWKKGNCVPSLKSFSNLCGILDSEPSQLAPFGIEAISTNSKNSIMQWLEKLDLAGKGAKEKFIPPMIFTLQRQQVALFLNRLFATDGWATVLASGSAQLGYATVSEKLARQIQHLLLRFGIIASLRKRNVLYQNTRRPAWQLDITDSLSIQTFNSEIGIFGKERATAAVKSALQGKRYQTNRDLIPREVWNQIATAKGSEPWAALARRGGIKGYTNIHAGKRSPTRERLHTLAKALGNSPLQDLAKSDVYWDEIVSIEPLGLKQVYDLTIPETHNFVANDICVHNTSLAMNIAEHVVLEQKLPVAVFSLEMSAEALVLRMMCSLARVNLRSIREGFMSESDFPKLTSAAGRLAGAPLFIDDSAGLSILQLRARARRLAQQHGIKLFVIDYLQLLHSTARRAQENRQQEISDISSGIKALAKELKVPVLVLSQLNRELERDKSRKPRLSDLRESGAIEQDADVVGLLYKPNAGDDEDGAAVEEPDGLPINLLIAKQRNGPTGDVNLTFLKPYTRFESAAKVSDEDVPVD